VIISDSFLKANLGHVVWIGGAGYGGKSTIADLLADSHGLQAYHPEDLFHEHKRSASPEDHPALTAPSHGWEWFFNRPTDEYVKAISDASREQFQMVVLDLVKLGAHGNVVVEGCMIDPWFTTRVVDHNRAIFLYADAGTIAGGFFARADKQDMLAVIDTLEDPAKTRRHVLETVCVASSRARAEAEAAGVKVLVRGAETDTPGTLAAVEQHLGLG